MLERPENRGASTDTVSQAEVERLLAQLGPHDPLEPEPAALPSRNALEAQTLVQTHGFPQLSLFSATDLRKLRLRHEEFIRSLAVRLSVYLRFELGLQMAKIETASFQKFIDSLANPTHLTLVGLEPLTGTCLLEIPPRLGLSLVDREMGGPGVCGEEPRDLNPMESRILSHVVEMIVGEWCSSWSDMLDLRPVLRGSESSGRFLQTSAPDHIMLVLGIEVRLGELVEQMQFAFPYQALEALMPKLNSKSATSPQAAPPQKAPPLKWNPLLGEVNLSITAALADFQLTARQLAHLKPGDVLPIPEEMVTRVELCVEKLPKFLGTLGTVAGKSALKIERVLSKG